MSYNQEIMASVQPGISLPPNPEESEHDKPGQRGHQGQRREHIEKARVAFGLCFQHHCQSNYA